MFQTNIKRVFECQEHHID